MSNYSLFVVCAYWLLIMVQLFSQGRLLNISVHYLNDSVLDILIVSYEKVDCKHFPMKPYTLPKFITRFQNL